MLCKIEKAARNEYMNFLSWFAINNPTVYKRIMKDYIKCCKVKEDLENLEIEKKIKEDYKE